MHLFSQQAKHCQSPPETKVITLINQRFSAFSYPIRNIFIHLQKQIYFLLKKYGLAFLEV